MIQAFKDKVIAVISGGLSEEAIVSLRSGKNVQDALVRLGYSTVHIDPATTDLFSVPFDVAFIALHGPHGEDGSIQSLLQKYKIPFTGSGPSACLMSMDKGITKMIMNKEGFPTANYQIITRKPQSWPLKIALPVIIKPISLGSSVGIEICHTESDYTQKSKAQIEAFECCLVEELVQGQEITVGVIERDGVAVALPILELKPKTGFYDYEAKYTPDMTEFIIPANISDTLTEQAKALAIQLHQTLGCKGMSRTDFMVDPQKGLVVLELNAIPGLTDLSDLPAQAKAAGISFDELIEIILESAI